MTTTTRYELQRTHGAVTSPAEGAIPLHPGSRDGDTTSTEWMVPADDYPADEHLATIRDRAGSDLHLATEHYVRHLEVLARQAKTEATWIREGNRPGGLSASVIVETTRLEARWHQALHHATVAHVPTETICGIVTNAAALIDEEGHYR